MHIFRIILEVKTRKKSKKPKKKYFYDMTIVPTKRPFPRYSGFLVVQVVQWSKLPLTPYKIKEVFGPLTKKFRTTTFFSGPNFLIQVIFLYILPTINRKKYFLGFFYKK